MPKKSKAGANQLANAILSLPPDPDGQNDDRASWATRALAAFQAETGAEDSDALPDLIADLMHLCDRTNRSFKDALHKGIEHYCDETEQKGPQSINITIRGALR